MKIKIAALQYQYDFPPDFKSYQKKISHLVSTSARQGADLLLFPEYAGFEMCSFAPSAELQKWIPSYLDLFQKLSEQYQIYICAGSQIVQTEKGLFNRSYFFSPSQKKSHQDKCILTLSEREDGNLSSSNDISVFETKFGKIGICVCYDIEFPQIVQQLVNKGAKLILVPSYTSSVHGFYRVFTSCRARALENQCYVVQSALIGKTDVEIAYGSSAICSPIDEGFPEDGLLAVGQRDHVETVIASLDLHLLDTVRTSGQMRNFQDSKLLKQRDLHCELLDLR